jgi:hypothetical protein
MIDLDKLYAAPVGFSRIGMDNVIKELIKFKHRMDRIGETFFLCGATCLGIVRDGGLIKHDKDIDIGVLGEESLYRIEKKLSKYYDQSHIVGAENGKILWLKNIVGEGILPIEVAAQYIEDDCLFYNRDMGKSWLWRKGRCVWPKRLFDKFEKVNYQGIDFNVPSPVEEFLTLFYGADWRTPSHYKDWRYNCYNLYKGWL